MLKHRLTLFFATLTLFVGLSLPAAAVDGWRASVPFDFVVQGVTFPAGTYDVLATSSPQVVLVRNQANLKQSFLMVLPAGGSLVNGSARLPLELKPGAPVKMASQGGQK